MALLGIVLALTSRCYLLRLAELGHHLRAAQDMYLQMLRGTHRRGSAVGKASARAVSNLTLNYRYKDPTLNPD